MWYMYHLKKILSSYLSLEIESFLPSSQISIFHLIFATSNKKHSTMFHPRLSLLSNTKKSNTSSKVHIIFPVTNSHVAHSPRFPHTLPPWFTFGQSVLNKKTYLRSPSLKINNSFFPIAHSSDLAHSISSPSKCIFKCLQKSNLTSQLYSSTFTKASPRVITKKSNDSHPPCVSGHDLLQSRSFSRSSSLLVTAIYAH